MASTGMTFPRTMNKGQFAGQTFQTITEYQAALRMANKKRKPAAKRAKATTNGGPQRKPAAQKKKDEHAEYIAWIIGMFSSFMEVGASAEVALEKTTELSRP